MSRYAEADEMGGSSMEMYTPEAREERVGKNKRTEGEIRTKVDRWR
jgi:hypothetical protein